ncbi:tetratricopeptide repeat protein [Roseovarius amoyensis]|uniref:tetratricopeptide repeat protein n=1 Tax=Roseovarius amoyensis TaxID=2211448 RepID=UPI0013A6DCDD|nr:tetratricopeptide repeat protein [Roseovarius amoyensis]
MRYISGVAAVLGAAISMTAGQGLAQSGAAAQRCQDIAGVPDSGAPVSRDALAAHFGRLGEARAHCEAAVIGPDPDTVSLFHLAVIMQREGVHERALEVFSMAAEAGLATAHTKLGDYYNFGIGPVPEDHTRAVAEYQKAAAAGDAPAKSTLAIMYQIGRGVPQDFDRLIELLKESADAGYHFAQFRLAELYMNPGAIPQRMAQSMDLPDPIKAAELYELAAAQGSAEAEAALKKFYEGGTGFDDPEVQMKWLRHGAQNGNAQAMNALGFMYEQGNGVEYDPVRAAELYIEALKTGDLPVSQLRGTVNGRQVRWDRETAINFQNILQYLGYYNGALDAMVGPGTLGAAQRLAQGE